MAKPSRPAKPQSNAQKKARPREEIMKEFNEVSHRAGQLSYQIEVNKAYIKQAHQKMLELNQEADSIKEEVKNEVPTQA